MFVRIDRMKVWWDRFSFLYLKGNVKIIFNLGDLKW